MDKVDSGEVFEDEEFFDEDMTDDGGEFDMFDGSDPGHHIIEGVAQDIKDKTEEAAHDIKAKTEEVTQDIKDKTKELKDKVEVTRDKVIEDFTEYVGSVRSSIEASRRGFNVADQSKNQYMLRGDLAEIGYDWWWHSFTGHNKKTGEARVFFIEYYLMNPAIGGSDVVYGQLLDNKEAGIRPSYMMVKAGMLGKKGMQLHRFFPWDEVEVDEGVPFSVSADDCLCTENRLVGSVKLTKKEAKEHPEYMCDGGSMSWDLFVEKQIAFNVGVGTDKPIRDLAKYEMAWHAEGIKSVYGGIVTVGKDEYIVRPGDCYGYADKNWGSSFTVPWIWLASNDLRSRISGERLDNSAFVIGGGRPVMGGGKVELEGQLLGALWYEGRPIEFNFAKPLTMPKTQFRVVEGKNKVTWKVIQKTPRVKVYTSIECPKSEMLNNNYESPSGNRVHNKLWLGGTGTGYIKIYEREADGLKLDWKLSDYIEVASCGCEYGE